MISSTTTITTSQASSATTYAFYGLYPPITLNVDPTTAVAQVVPIQPVPAQALTVALGGQQCQINLSTKDISVPVAEPGSIVTDPPVLAAIQVIYVDLYVNDALVIGGCLARNGVGVVQNDYLDFVGEIVIEDTQPDPVLGPSDPFYAGLGSRFVLSYWSNP